jgi:hypothetical protein
MKFPLVLLAAILSSHANADPKKFEAEGVYTANSTVSQAPPRSTHALIEPDGDFWAADFIFTREAQSSVITGEIDTRTGEGIALDYVMDPPVPLSVKTTKTHHTVRFALTPYVEGMFSPSGYYNAPGPFPPYRPGPFDFDLVQIARAKLDLRAGSYTTVSPYFAITFDKDEFTGYNGNCPFAGRLKDGEERHYKRVTLTYTSACYLSASKQVPVLKNSKLQGVVFASKRSDFLNGQVVQTDAIVMIMRPKAGQYNLGFSRMFNR